MAERISNSVTDDPSNIPPSILPVLRLPRWEGGARPVLEAFEDVRNRCLILVAIFIGLPEFLGDELDEEGSALLKNFAMEVSMLFMDDVRLRTPFPSVASLELNRDTVLGLGRSAMNVVRLLLGE